MREVQSVCLGAVAERRSVRLVAEEEQGDHERGGGDADAGASGSRRV
jgi:hypothetical protein